MAYYLKDPLALNGQTACDPPEVINDELFLVFFFSWNNFAWAVYGSKNYIHKE